MNYNNKQGRNRPTFKTPEIFVRDEVGRGLEFYIHERQKILLILK